MKKAYSKSPDGHKTFCICDTKEVVDHLTDHAEQGGRTETYSLDELAPFVVSD